MFELLKKIEVQKPIVHSLTNYVTVNDCANVILASGGSPIMADEPQEMPEIVAISNSVVINIGTLNRVTLGAMKIAGREANRLKIPVILDPVGVSASAFRQQAVRSLLKEVHFSVIKGNSAEILYLYRSQANARGVDAGELDRITLDNLDETITIAKALSERYRTIIALTSDLDVVTDSESVAVIHNGHFLMSKVTGTGCMLAAMLGNYVGIDSSDYFKNVAYGVAAFGISGEIAADKLNRTQCGIGTYKQLLIDGIWQMDDHLLLEAEKIEFR